MTSDYSNAESSIRLALREVAALLARAFEIAGPATEPGGALDQAGLHDGARIVEDYLHHGEAGLALEHLIYMVHESALAISPEGFAHIERAGQAMGMAPHSW